MRDIPIHTLSALLGPSRCLALPLFHAVTGCDTVSHFLGCGKKSAWSVWQSTPGLTDTLVELTSELHELNPQSQHMRTLERFVVVLYSKGCGLERINEARLRLFTSGKKTLEALPEQCCRLASSGVRPPPRTALVGGCPSGQPLRTAARPVPSFYSVAVRSPAKGAATGAELAFVA